MQQDPLLATKLYIPSIRPELVSRPRLIERLNEGHRSGCKLTLISAPAGFGKTTLVSEWVQTVGAYRDAPQVAWLSLDESDNDVTRFLVYFVAALRTVQANIGKGILSALQSPKPPPAEAILASLINEIAAIPPMKPILLDSVVRKDGTIPVGYSQRKTVIESSQGIWTLQSSGTMSSLTTLKTSCHVLLRTFVTA